MQKLKLTTIIGTRPEIIRLSEVIKLCERCFEHTLVHTGQNYDYNLSDVFFKELGLRQPDYYLGVAGDNLGATMGAVIAKSYDVLKELRPDAVLILGDTNSALSAIPAKRLKIPVFHMEAGNRCFDQNLPEELNRRIVDHISDVNLPYTEHARRYLLSEGIRKDFIFVTGTPMAEVLKAHSEAIEASDVLDRLGLLPGEYLVLSAHREENIDDENNFMSLMNAVNKVAERYQMPIIFSAHPRSRAMLQKRGFALHPLVRGEKPFGFFDYNKLQKNAFCVVSDSGTLPEEASILRFPGVSIRTSTERPEALDKGNVIIGGITEKEALQAIELCRAMWEAGEHGAPVPDYQDTNVSEKVVKIIQSYTHIVDRVVWRKTR